MSSDNQRLEPTQILGLKFRTYSASVKGLALSKPADYFAIKSQALIDFEDALVTEIYDKFYKLLKDGEINGKRIAAASGSSATPPSIPMKPEYPTQKINNLCLEVCSDLSAHIEKALSIILPDDFTKIAESNISMKTKGGLIE